MLTASSPSPVTGSRLHPLLAVTALAVALTGLSPAAHAQTAPNACGDGKAILQNAYPAARPKAGEAGYLLGERRVMLPAQEDGNIPAMVCKVWPAHDNLLLVAVPRMDAKSSLETDRVGDLDILVVDRATHKTLQRLTLPDAMSDDAVQITKVEFDTARYVLAPGIQAFGLRIHRTGASRVNPFGETSLRLFTMREGASGMLRVVLDRLSTARSGGEWDGNCAGTFSDSKAVLAMTNDVHQGFFDIRVSVTGEDTTEGVGKQGDCKESVTKTPRAQHTLAYDGKRYVVPDALKGL